MKKVIIATVISAVIMFVWTALSHMILPVHTHSYKHTANATQVMDCLNANLSEDGFYMIPYPDPDAPDFQAKMQEMQTSAVGKPWAQIFYHKSMNDMNPLQFLKAFLYYLIMSFLGAVILMIGSEKLTSFMQRLWVMMLLPIIIVLATSLQYMNWMDWPMHFEMGNIIDAFVMWLLGGSVLAAMVKKG